MSPSRPNILEILKQLPRSNCGKCRLPTCMAFANQVAQGLRKPGDCPYLDPTTLDLAALGRATPESPDQEELLLELRERIGAVDLAAVADRTGGRVDGDTLVVSCLGRDFLIDNQGNLRSACHANFWVLIPLLDYVIQAAGPLPSGVAPEPIGPWIKYDELGQGLSQSDFFSKSCEGALCRLHDDHPDVFPELLDLFGAKHVDHGFEADLSVLLHPLPRVPLLVCYWEADPPFESKLSIYFDRSTPARLSGEATVILIMGIVEMLKRIVTRHTFATGSRKPQPA